MRLLKTLQKNEKNKKERLTESEKNKIILSALALNGPLKRDGIAAKSGIPKSTVYEAIHGKTKNRKSSLLTKVLVTIDHKEKCRNPQIEMPTYVLTLRGLIEILRSSEDLWADIDKIVGNWKNLLPLIFERWDFFKKQGLNGELKKALKWSVLLQENDYSRRPLDSGSSYVLQGFITYITEHLGNVETKMKWDKAIHADNELMKVAEEYLNEQLKQHQEHVDDKKIRIKIIEELQKPNPNWETIKNLDGQLKAIPPFLISRTWNLIWSVGETA